MLSQSKYNKISDSAAVRGEGILCSTEKMESDKEKPEKEINLFSFLREMELDFDKIMYLKENTCFPSANGLLECGPLWITVLIICT